jgi:hypothetical protein
MDSEQTPVNMNEQVSMAVSILSSVACLVICASLLAVVNCIGSTAPTMFDVESGSREVQLPAYERPPSYKTKASSLAPPCSQES